MPTTYPIKEVDRGVRNESHFHFLHRLNDFRASGVCADSFSLTLSLSLSCYCCVQKTPFRCVMLGLITPLLVAILAIAAYFLGIFDRPAFEHQPTLSPTPLFALMTTSTEKNIGSHIQKMLKDTKSSIQALPGGTEQMFNAAQLYGTPAHAVALGLYFDDPGKVDAPRWAVGFAVEAKTFEDLQVMARSSSAYPIQAVRIPTGPILKASIPWRTALTPMIAPMLHWKRAFDLYKSKGLSSFNHRGGDEDEDAAIALEIYVDEKRNRRIDYVVLTGDTTVTWNDCFPIQTIAAHEAVERHEEQEHPVEPEPPVQQQEVPQAEERAAPEHHDEHVQTHQQEPEPETHHHEPEVHAEPEQEVQQTEHVHAEPEVVHTAPEGQAEPVEVHQHAEPEREMQQQQHQKQQHQEQHQQPEHQEQHQEQHQGQQHQEQQQQQLDEHHQHHDAEGHEHAHGHHHHPDHDAAGHDHHAHHHAHDHHDHDHHHHRHHMDEDVAGDHEEEEYGSGDEDEEFYDEDMEVEYFSQDEEEEHEE